MLITFFNAFLIPFVIGQTTQTFQLHQRFQFTYTLFELLCDTQTWCAIGFGTGHPNADIIRLNAVNNIVGVEDLILKPTSTYNPPVKDPEQDVTLVTGWTTATQIYGKVNRKLITDDTQDFQIPLMHQVPMIWAVGDGPIDQAHLINGTFKVTFGNPNPPICHYLCNQCLGPLKSDCVTCSVTDAESLNGYCAESDVDELLASKQIIADDFIVSWGYDEPGYIHLMLTVQKCDWFGIGFGAQMINTDIIMFTLTEIVDLEAQDTKYKLDVHDMWASSNQVPDEDIMRVDGTNDWTLMGYEYDSKTNLIRAKAKRRIDTGDPWDYLFAKQDIRISYAFGNNTNGRILYHKANRGVILARLSQNDTRNLLSVWGDFVYRGHTILLFVFWAIISDIGVFFARQLKSYPKYAKVHGMIFLFQSIITYFFVFAMINFNKDKIQELSEYPDLLIAHFAIGIIVISLITIQLFFGMMVKNNLESLNGSERVYRLKKFHQIFGYVLYIFTKINVALGMEYYQPGYLFWFYAWYVLLFLIRLTIEMLFLFEVSIIPRRRITYHYIETDKNFLYDRLIERINQGQPRHDTLKEFPKLRYVMLREAIYDVSDFNHPGGQFIIDAIRGREVGRYFYGGSPVEKLDITPHKHSAFAINYIETRYIGDHKNELCPILYHEEAKFAQSKKSDRQIWKFKESRKVSGTCSLFVFQSSYFKVRQQLKGVQWFGRYFYIKPYGGGLLLTERPYSVILCLSDENIKFRQEIIDFFKAKTIDVYLQQNVQQPRIDDIKFSNTLCFLIKKQPASLHMSKFIHDTFHKPYEITGPYGLGLEINEHSNGVHYIFCNGTGILPFLDLIDYLLKKALYTILHDKCGFVEAEQMNPTGEDYLNTFGSDFRLVLCGTFKNKFEFHGYPIVQDLYFICKSFELNYFDMCIRLSDQKADSELQKQNINQSIITSQEEMTMIHERFDATIIQNIMKYTASKVYVCGSPQFEDDILASLKTIGVHKKNIVIV